MSALSLSRLPVPSSRLLKFLRAQSDPECFFTANRPGAISCCHNTSAPDNATGISAARAASLVRRLSTTAKRAATVESSSSLDSLPPGTVSGPPRRTSPILQTVGHPRTFCRRDVLFPKDSRRTISESRPWRQGILRLGKKAKRKDATTHDCLRPLASFLDNGTESSVSSFGRVAANKAANELKLRCTEFDEQGRVTLVNGEFKKSELIAKVPSDDRRMRPTTYANARNASTVCSLEISARSTRRSSRSFLSESRPSWSTCCTYGRSSRPTASSCSTPTGRPTRTRSRRSCTISKASCSRRKGHDKPGGYRTSSGRWRRCSSASRPRWRANSRACENRWCGSCASSKRTSTGTS